LRENGVNAEFYPDLGESNKAQKRQWKYVSNREIEYVVSKIENDLFVLKHMLSNEQVTCSLSALITKMTSS
jgi:histidyl-tRNA synthetase